MGGLITQGMFFGFQLGGPINGEAHKVGTYKLEVYGRFKGWGSREGPLAIKSRPKALQINSCADNTDVCVYYNRFIVMNPNTNSVLISRIFFQQCILLGLQQRVSNFHKLLIKRKGKQC